MPTPIYLEDIQPFINFVNGNIGTKLFSTDAFSTWQGGAGRPVVATGVGYGTTLGYFPPSSVLSVNGKVGIVVLTNADVGLGNVQNVDTTNASNITTGMLPLSVIPAAALERLVHVADEAARFALTTAQVQNGDTVMQDDIQIMYRVIDDTHLGDASGYQEYRAGLAAQVHWSGVLDVPQSLVDIGAITGAEKDMLIYSGGQWIAVQPLAARANLDLPIKGGWDMSPVTQQQDILQYPVMDGVAEFIGAAPFPTVSGDDSVHSFSLFEGNPPFFAYAAATANGFQVLTNTGSVGDLPLPTGPNVTAILLDVSSDMTAALLGSGQVIAFSGIFARNAAMTKGFSVFIQVANSPSGIIGSVSSQYEHPGGTDTLVSQAIPLTFPVDCRVVVYFEGATGKVGFLVNGVDQGWIGGLTPFVLPADITTICAFVEGTYSSIQAGDPQIGATVSLRHSIDPLAITEGIPGNFVPWLTVTTHDPYPPVGAEVGNRYYALPGGSYNGVAAETGDIVEFMDATTIFVYPKASSLVRLTQYQADIGALQTDLANYISATDTHLTTLDGQVSGLQTTTGDHETRITTLETDVALIGIPDLLQRALRALTQTGRSPGVLYVHIVNDVPFTGLGGADGFLVGNSPTGAFAGYTPGNLVLQDGLAWTQVVPFDNMVITTQSAGTQAYAAYGGGLRWVGTGNEFSRLRTGLETSNVPPGWVCTKLEGESDTGSPRWVFTGNPGNVSAPIYADRTRAITVVLDPAFTGSVIGTSLVFDNVSTAAGVVMVENQSAVDVSFAFSIFNGPNYHVVLVNEDTGDTYGPGIAQSLPLGRIPAGASWRVDWAVDAQAYNLDASGVIRVYTGVKEIRPNSSTVTLTATALSGTLTVPAGADLVNLTTSTLSGMSQTYVLPFAREGKRIVFRAVAPIWATFSAQLGNSVDSACASLQLLPGDLCEIGLKGTTWYLLSRSNSALHQEVVLTANTTLNSTKALTLDGTGVIGQYNTIATSPTPVGSPRNSTQASHHIVIEGCASGVFYYRESILRTRCYGPTFMAVGETLIAEEWDGMPVGATTSVAIDASQSDGLLRITVGSTGVLGDMSWKAFITTRTNAN